jgi:hypothetical protein
MDGFQQSFRPQTIKSPFHFIHFGYKDFYTHLLDFIELVILHWLAATGKSVSSLLLSRYSLGPGPLKF